MHFGDGLGHDFLRLGQRQRVLQINLVNAAGAFLGGTVDFDFSINAARAQNGRVNQIGPIGGEDDDHVLQRLQAVHLRAEHGHQGAENGAVTAGPARAQNGFRLVNEQKGERAFGGALAALGEKVAHLPFRLAHPHVEDFGAFDVQKELRMVHPRLGAGFAGAN